jgi:3-oxoacyl-[acyl-carrier-protein] synthase-3
MVSDDIYIAGYGSHLPPVTTAAEAIAAGMCDPLYVSAQQMAGVTTGSESGPEMAVAAGRDALRRAERYVDGVDLLLHSALYYQGHDMWAPASYVQRYTGGLLPGSDACPAIDIRQTSNGGMASVALAAAYLADRPHGRGALLTTGDHFCRPGIDRWRSDPGTVFADGGTAIVLARGTGFARLRSLALISDSELESMHRGDDPWHPAPMSARMPLDVRVTTRDFLRTAGSAFVTARMAAGQEAVVKAALAEADTTIGEIDLFVLPNFGARRMEPAFFRPFGIDPDRTTWPWGRGIGHLGAGDQFAGLTYLIESDRLHAGDVCAMLGVGGGFTWSCAVIEIVGEPPRD